MAITTTKDASNKYQFWWKLFFIVAISIDILFIILLLSVQAIWFDINSFINYAVNANLNWILLILIIIIIVSLVEIYRFLINIRNFKQNLRINLQIGDIIFCIFFSILCITLTFVLISEMGNEKGLLLFGIRTVAPWIIFSFGLTIFIGIQPKIARLWKGSKKDVTTALGVNIIISILLISSVVLIVQHPTGIGTMKTDPYLQYKASNEISILWITNTECVSWVEYGIDESIAHIAYSTSNGQKDIGQINKVSLSDLSEGTTYYYKVFSQEIKQIFPCNAIFGKTVESKLYQFTTPTNSSDTVSFLAFADVHEQTKIFTELLSLEGYNDYNMVFLDGDVLNHVDSIEQISELFISPQTDNYASEIPFAFIRGNLETRGELSRNLIDFLDTPTNQFYYSFNLGKVHFTILDSGEDKDDSDIEYSGLNNFTDYRDEQTLWLEQEISSDAYQNAIYRVVFVHIPLNEYLSEENPEDFKNYQQIWCNLLNSSGANMMISGHEHKNDIFLPQSENNPFNFPIILTGGYEVENRAMLKCDITASNIDLYILQSDGTSSGHIILNYEESL